jgi:hypothetical protein
MDTVQKPSNSQKDYVAQILPFDGKSKKKVKLVL